MQLQCSERLGQEDYKFKSSLTIFPRTCLKIKVELRASDVFQGEGFKFSLVYYRNTHMYLSKYLYIYIHA